MQYSIPQRKGAVSLSGTARDWAFLSALRLLFFRLFRIGGCFLHGFAVGGWGHAVFLPKGGYQSVSVFVADRIHDFFQWHIRFLQKKTHIFQLCRDDIFLWRNICKFAEQIGKILPVEMGKLCQLTVTVGR